MDSNKEILEKAIQKAIDGGWEEGIAWLSTIKYTDSLEDELLYASMGIIFNHDFAKALWSGSTNADRPMWHFRLQQMVIAEDPIKYLAENMGDVTQERRELGL